MVVVLQWSALQQNNFAFGDVSKQIEREERRAAGQCKKRQGLRMRVRQSPIGRGNRRRDDCLSIGRKQSAHQRRQAVAMTLLSRPLESVY